jgi:sodium/bile acid cotransporter 7
VLAPGLLPAPLWAGLILLSALPSTVQASIAFTSVAGGNVPAALCSASASNLLGVILTPVIAGLLLTGHGADLSARSVFTLVLQLLVPFAAGQLLRPWIGDLVTRNARALKAVDYGSILLIVYSAFSEAVSEGLWHQVPLSALAGLLVADGILLAAALMITALVGKWSGFERADRVAIIFCGSKKSLSQGVTMAKVIFASHAVGAVILPLMLFHQIQLMVCAALAQRWGRRAESPDLASGGATSLSAR